MSGAARTAALSTRFGRSIPRSACCAHPRLGPVHARRDASDGHGDAGTKDDEQRLELLESGETSKRFMLHYNFPPFSVGEVGFMRGPGRREIGHGALAEARSRRSSG